MGEITYVRGDATTPQGKGVKVIAHVCNDLGGWGKGFVLALSRRWPEPEAAYRPGSVFGLPSFARRAGGAALGCVHRKAEEGATAEHWRP
ncbi:hypothetical protein ACIQI7_36810, partial [Kitasatospora sp. NPDC092039]